MTQGSHNQNGKEMPGALPVGSKVAKYEIVQQLAAGGQSIVYKGYDALLDRFVAIKQIAPFLAADQKFIERFREVSRQLAKLGCEQVVTIHDLIEDPLGLFVVMEFVEGRTLEAMLAGSGAPMDPKTVVQIVWRVAAGLSALHRAGIIHRDIKPSNLIIGDGLRVKITDFGVAMRTGAPASMRLGTTKYMAPELFAGGEVDGRADIYSLGMVAYEMAAGREKFQEVFHDVVRDPYSESLRWMKWHSAADQAAPPLEEVQPGVPAALSAIVARMMAKDVAARYQNVEDLGREIRASFSPRPQAARSQRKRRAAPLEAQATGEVGELSAERANELTVGPGSADGPATAQIPKAPMTLGRKLAIAGGIVAVLVGVLTGVIIHSAGKDRDLRRRADIDFAKAGDMFRSALQQEALAPRQEGLTGAQDAFADVRQRFQFQTASRAVAQQAKVMEQLCQAYLTVLNNNANWEKDADDYVRKAAEGNATIQRESKELYDWTKKTDDVIHNFRGFFESVRNWRSNVALIEQALNGDDLDRAESALREEPPPPLKEYSQQSLALKDKIDLRRRENEYWTHFKAADAAGKNSGPGAFATAKAEYAKALEVLESYKDTLPETEYDELKAKAQNSLATLVNEADYAAAKVEGDKLVGTGNRIGAADAYDRALKKKPADPEGLKDRIATLRHDHWLEVGRQFITAGNYANAEDAFKKAQGFKDTPAVQGELAKLQQRKNFKSIVDQGIEFYNKKNYESALQKFQDANKLIKDDLEVKNWIMKAQYAIEMNTVNATHSAKQWDKCRDALTRAKQINPGETAKIDELLEKLKSEQAFDDRWKDYQKARAGRKWQEAIIILNDARKIMATPEIDPEISDCRYWLNVDMGDKAVADGDFDSARAYYGLARQYKTPPPQELLDKIEAAQKGKTPTTRP